MAIDEGSGGDGGEDGFAARQDGRVYPVGRALRTTYDAENHDSLGHDLTGLMIDLSRVPFEAEERPHAPAESLPSDRGGAVAGRSDGWLARLGHLFARR